MIDKDFAKNIEFTNQQSELPSFRYRDEKIIEFIGKLECPSRNILDIGERNRLTEKLEQAYSLKIDSTQGDLDENSNVAKVVKYAPYQCHTLHDWDFGYYDLVIFSHVIEHLFNPLLCLENIKLVMKPDALLVICTPVKPHFLPWGKGHFHEMDQYRFKKLIARAGLEIIQWERFRNGPLLSNLGIRPILRKIFFKEQSFIICKKY